MLAGLKKHRFENLHCFIFERQMLHYKQQKLFSRLAKSNKRNCIHSISKKNFPKTQLILSIICQEKVQSVFYSLWGEEYRYFSPELRDFNTASTTNKKYEIILCSRINKMQHAGLDGRLRLFFMSISFHCNSIISFVNSRS